MLNPVLKRNWRSAGFRNMRVQGFVLLAVAISQMAAAADKYPSAKIENGLVSAEFYLPDPQSGSYRATRFDWSGIIRNLTFAGHTYFGQWYEKHDPLVHDAITGPVNVFDSGSSPPGFELAKVGGTFIHVGVGRLERPDDAAYQDTRAYRIVDSGTWRIESDSHSIRFVQNLPRSDSDGFAYRYTKQVSLPVGKPQMVISQVLENTGTKQIDTRVYNHGFFQIDKEHAGPNLVWRFPFEPKTSGDFNGMAAIDGREVRYLRELKPGERAMAQLTGYGKSATDHRFTLENTRTGAGVRVSGDHPITKLTFWSRRDGYSPEASIELHIAPGERTTWQTTYDFYTTSGEAKQ